MAEFTSRNVTEVRREYALPALTNWAEVNKVFAMLINELGEQARWDDAVKVEARGEEIVFWYALSSQVTHG